MFRMLRVAIIFYSRPVYYLLDEGSEDWYMNLVYSGNRWFGTELNLTASNITWDHVFKNNIEYHAFWAKAYHGDFTSYVSDPTTEDTPVGVDFYWIEERGEQFGSFGSLVPLQHHNQTGRGYFRCGGRSKY